DLLEAHVPAVLLHAGALDGEGPHLPGDLDLECGAGLQALLGLVGAQRQRDLAAQTVGAADGRDDDVERAHERPSWVWPPSGAAPAAPTALLALAPRRPEGAPARTR